METYLNFEIHPTSSEAQPFFFHHVSDRLPYRNWHENVEFMYCTKGSGILHYDSIDYKIKEGDIAVINSYAIHYTESDDGLVFKALIPFSDFFSQHALPLSKMHFAPIINDSVAAEKYREIIKNRESSDNLSKAKMLLSVLDFLIYLTENHLEEASVSAKKIDISIRQALSYINSDYSKKLTADSISRKAGFSKYHFLREFKKATGQTFSDYLTKIRIDNAKKLLKSTPLPVKEICYKTGFESEAYFSKVFKSLCELTPTEYRKK